MTTGQVLVTPPAIGSWDTYQLTVCEVASPASCVAGVPACTVVAGTATCGVPGLEPGTPYQVFAVAQAAGQSDSPPSANTTFSTPVP